MTTNNWKQIGIETYNSGMYGRDDSESGFESAWGECHNPGEDQEMAGCDFGIGWADAAGEDLVSDAMRGKVGTDGGYSWIWEGVDNLENYTDEQVRELVGGHAQTVFDNIVWDFGDKYGKEFPMDTETFLKESDFEDAVKAALIARDDKCDEATLNEVMTAAEVMAEYGLSESTVRQALNRESLRGRKSGETWLVLRKHAAARWGK